MAGYVLRLYALSTCIHCRHAKEFLELHRLKYELVHADALVAEERKAVMKEVLKYNPRLSFPTLIVNDGEDVIVGFNEEKYQRLIYG